MTSKVASKRLWRSIERYVRRKQGRVRVRQLARRFKLAPSNVSRGLRRRGISLAPTAFPWETSSHPNRQEQVQKCRQVLALYFLGLNRNQIEQLLPIKSETVRSYILALTLEVRNPETQPYRLFCDDALESLAKQLDKAYGLGDHVRDSYLALGRDLFSADASAFLRQFRRFEPPPAVLMRKLRQILGTRVYRHGQFLHVVGRKGRLVRVRVLPTRIALG
jgi:hypothetical protein